MSDKRFDIFAPLALVMAALIAAYTLESVTLWKQRQQSLTHLEQLQPLAMQAAQWNSTLRDLTRDVVELSAYSEGARKVVQEFRIQQQP